MQRFKTLSPKTIPFLVANEMEDTWEGIISFSNIEYWKFRALYVPFKLLHRDGKCLGRYYVDTMGTP